MIRTCGYVDKCKPELTRADQACTQYPLSIPWRNEFSSSSTKNPGVDFPAQRNIASGVRPPCGWHAASRAAAEEAWLLSENEYDLRI
jgi:hypothetical protein